MDAGDPATLSATHRVVAPDLPGHGASEVTEGELDAGRVLAWLGELIERTCSSPPALVGHLGSGSIAARFAVEHSERLSSLVLVDSFGLGKFRPSPGFALALFRYVARPTERTYDGLMQRCTVDFAGVRAEMGERWEPFEDVHPRSCPRAEREGGAPRAHAGAGGARDSAGGPRADRRSDDPDLGTTRSR